MEEMMEITVVVYEGALKAMLEELEEAKKKGDHSVMIEQGPVTFHVCSALEATDPLEE
jgi:intracellular sulfur oxidation DsrE/DsrF family protein